MRRKAAASPVVINNQKLRTASELTQERRLMASSDFSVNGQQYGTMRGDLLLTETAVNQPVPTSFKKQTGRPKNASDFTSFLGSHAVRNDVVFPSAGKTVNIPCPPIPNPKILLNGSTVVLNRTLSISSSRLNIDYYVGNGPYNPSTQTLRFSGTLVVTGDVHFQVGFNSFYLEFSNATGNKYTTLWFNGNPTFLPSPTSGDKFTLTINSTGAICTYTPTTHATNTYTSNGVLGLQDVFMSAIDTTGTLCRVNNAVYTVTNNPVSQEPIPYITGGQVKANTVARSGSDFIRERLACQKAQGEQHNASELGPSKFVDNTIRNPELNKAYLAGAMTCSYPSVEHKHPVHVPHQEWSARPDNSSIPVFNVPSLDHKPNKHSTLPNCFTGKNTTGVFSQGNVIPSKHPKYVEKHHGNDLHAVNPHKPIAKKYQIPYGSPAHLKINDPKFPAPFLYNPPIFPAIIPDLTGGSTFTGGTLTIPVGGHASLVSQGYDPALYNITLTATIGALSTQTFFVGFNVGNTVYGFFFNDSSIPGGAISYYDPADANGIPFLSSTTTTGGVMTLTINSSTLTFAYTPSTGTPVSVSYPAGSRLGQINALTIYDYAVNTGATTAILTNIKYTVQSISN